MLDHFEPKTAGVQHLVRVRQIHLFQTRLSYRLRVRVMRLEYGCEWHIGFGFLCVLGFVFVRCGEQRTVTRHTAFAKLSL